MPVEATPMRPRRKVKTGFSRVAGVDVCVAVGAQGHEVGLAVESVMHRRQRDVASS